MNLERTILEDVTEFLMSNNSDIKAYAATSALTGENVEQSFLDLVSHMV